MVRCAKLPASRILHKRINEKVHVDQRLPEGIWIAATEFIVNTPKLHVDRHRGVIRQSRSPGEDPRPGHRWPGFHTRTVESSLPLTTTGGRAARRRPPPKPRRCGR